MRVGIIGGGPAALEMATCIMHLGGAPVLVSPHHPLFEFEVWAKFFPEYRFEKWELITSDWSRALVGLSSSLEPTLANYFDYYLKPLEKKLIQADAWKCAEWLRTQKKHLGHDGDVPGKSRFYDLFRMVIKATPNTDNFPEELSEEMKESLKAAMESAEDVDIFVDARSHNLLPGRLGPGKTFALNEIDCQENPYLHYELHHLIEQVEEKKQVIVIGSTQKAAIAMIALEDWLFAAADRQLILVTEEERAFTELHEMGETNLTEKLDHILVRFEETHEHAKSRFHNKITRWKELEPHIRAKTPRPTEPSPKIEFYTGVSVMAVDNLIDRDGIFLTIERPDFRAGDELIKTFHSECVFVCTPGIEDDSSYSGMRVSKLIDEEPGFYRIGKSAGNWEFCIQNSITDVEHVKEDLLRKFGRKA